MYLCINGTYLLLLIFSLAKLFLFWLIGLPLAIAAIIVFRIYDGKVARAYDKIIAVYYKQFK
jgi:hypothetical protein